MVTKIQDTNWSDLEAKFRSLQQKNEDGLGAVYLSSGFKDEPRWEKSSWALRNSPSDSIEARFITLAIQGAKLAGRKATFESWLDLLREKEFGYDRELWAKLGDDRPNINQIKSQLEWMQRIREQINNIIALPLEQKEMAYQKAIKKETREVKTRLPKSWDNNYMKIFIHHLDSEIKEGHILIKKVSTSKYKSDALDGGKIIRVCEQSADYCERQSFNADSSTESLRDTNFIHSPDYRSVNIQGKSFTLTAQQAKVIEILYENYRSGTPDISQAHILTEIESPSSRLRDIFRSDEKAYKALIRNGEKRGTYRINL